MFKQKSYLSVQIGEREYQLICDTSSPIQELIDVLKIISDNAQKILDEANKKKECSDCECIDG